MGLLRKSRSKVFCIGSGKTGTTSVEKALRDFGYKMGNQIEGELLIHDYAARNFKRIIQFCKSAEAFQDAPFCFKYTYIPLDIAFPGSKFVLTVRDSSDQWFQSLVNFHTKIHGDKKNVPSIENLKNSEYQYKGYAWDVRSKVYGIDESMDPYDKSILTDYYESHNKEVIQYFNMKDNLLVLNVAEEGAYHKLCDFLDKKPLYDQFPWENKTSKLK